MLFKCRAECGLTGKTEGVGDLLDGCGGGLQQEFCSVHPGSYDIFMRSISGLLLEYTDKMIWAYMCLGCQPLHRQRFT